VDRSGTASPYNGDAVAAAFHAAQAVVVVLTPDDVGYLHPMLRGSHEREDDREPTGQPRLNVVLEAGMALQSHPSKTVLVELGRTREISDLAGRNTVRLDGTAQTVNSLANRLQSAGCPVERLGSDWLDGGAFAQLDAYARVASAPQLDVDAAHAARREARHVIVELRTIDRTTEMALGASEWWDVKVTGLPANQWAAARELLAECVPEVYDIVSSVYVEADQMNKAANAHACDGRRDFQDGMSGALEGLRGSIEVAENALRDFADSEY
jgi:hypothetical protein